MPDGLLSGITVLDLTEGAGGPFATRLMAGSGARVIKIERPGCGDPARRVGPFPAGSNPEAGALFIYLNTSKESVTLDFATATGRALLLDLAERADALVESHAPGHLEGLGLGAEALRRRNGRLVVTSVSAYGQSGPYAANASTNLTSFASGGQMYNTGEPDREPLQTAGHQAEYQAGIHAFGATLAGLYAAGSTGRGAHVDIAAMECMASALELYLADYSYLGRDVMTKRRGNMISSTIGIYPCADGHVGVHVMARNFASFTRVLGDESLLQDERFRTERDRLRNNDEMAARIYAWAAGATREEIYRRAGEERCTIAPILSLPEVLDHPHLRERETFQQLDVPGAGAVRVPGSPFRAGDAEWTLRPAPALGEHNSAVYGELLGLQPADLVRLRAAGVI